MRLVIDIPGEIRKAIFDDVYCGIADKRVYDAIKNGTPIPDNATNVLDAIKLEIKQEYDKQGDWSFNDGLAFVLEIIDKYAKENRNENGTLDI